MELLKQLNYESVKEVVELIVRPRDWTLALYSRLTPEGRHGFAVGCNENDQWWLVSCEHGVRTILHLLNHILGQPFILVERNDHYWHFVRNDYLEEWQRIGTKERAPSNFV